ncbi:MAG: type II toxin-antitoxin system RelE/ParE family toxin [Tepidiformaceae bacterium]
MTRPVVWRPAAVEELVAALEGYERQRPGLGTEFATACQAAVTLVRDRPELFRQVHGATRRVILRRFPYAIYYHVLHAEIVILAVTHGRRDPRRWQSPLRLDLKFVVQH